MKRLIILATLCTALTVAAPSAETPRTSVMTRNLYIGADLTPVITAQTLPAFGAAVQTVLGQIAASNFTERVLSLADEIIEKRPHLVAVQEAYRLTQNGNTGAPPFRDYLTDLLDVLAIRGTPYRVAAQVKNLDVAIPLPGSLIHAVDRDVILARADVASSALVIPGCRVSLDGCNYQFVARIASPVGSLVIERGFVGVDAVTEGGAIRFVNTHLEVPELPRIIQSIQAAELIARLAALPNPSSSPVVIAGDINSDPTDAPVTETMPAPYQQLANAGYLDAWTLRPGNPPGLTCCQSPDLLNPESVLFKRVDVIFLSTAPIQLRANLLGADPDERTASGLWPSDHAGVIATFNFAQN